MLDVAADEAVEVRDLADVLELVERHVGAVPAALLESKRQVEQCMQRRQRIDLRIELELRADPVGAERDADARLLEKVLDLGADGALQLLRVGALEAKRHIGDRGHAVQVDEDRDQALLGLPVAKRALEEARLAVLPRRVEPDEVAADGVPEQLLRLAVAVDDLLGGDGMRVDERIDVGDHSPSRLPNRRLLDELVIADQATSN